MTVSYDSVVWAYGMEDLFISGGNAYLRDSGPNGFHMRFPGGGANPTPTLTGELSFDGGDYLYYDGDLTRFYNKMPTREHTWLVLGMSSTQSGGQIQRFFSCWNGGGGGTHRGIAYGVDTTTASERVYAFQMQGGAGTVYAVSANAEPFARPSWSRVLCTRVSADQAGLHGGMPATYAWGGGAFGTASYDTAQIPRVGADPGATNFLIGRASYLALIRGAISSPDMASLSAMLSQNIKPWCVRR